MILFYIIHNVLHGNTPYSWSVSGLLLLSDVASVSTISLLQWLRRVTSLRNWLTSNSPLWWCDNQVRKVYSSWFLVALSPTYCRSSHCSNSHHHQNRSHQSTSVVGNELCSATPTSALEAFSLAFSIRPSFSRTNVYVTLFGFLGHRSGVRETTYCSSFQSNKST